MNGWLLAGIIAWLVVLAAAVVMLMWATAKLRDLLVRLEDKIMEQGIQDRLDDILSSPEEGKQDG